VDGRTRCRPWRFRRWNQTGDACRADPNPLWSHIRWPTIPESTRGKDRQITGPRKRGKGSWNCYWVFPRQTEDKAEDQTEDKAEDQTEDQTKDQTKDKAKDPPPAPKLYISATQEARLVAYVQSRGDQLRKYELRRRFADIAGGPALLWTSPDLAIDRKETATLFALLDADEDGLISSDERDMATKSLNEEDLNRDGRVDWNELHAALKPRSARRKISSHEFSWQSWDATGADSTEDLSVKVSFADKADQSSLAIENRQLSEAWRQNEATLMQTSPLKVVGQAAVFSHPKISIALTAVTSPDSSTSDDQLSVGVVMEGNPLHRKLDRDGDGSLSAVERRSCGELITSLDQNGDGSLSMDELPVLLRVCVGQGACAHEALNSDLSVIQSSRGEDGQVIKVAPPKWFVSMDRDGDRTLTREEFLGKRSSFEEMDTDNNDLLSVSEVLATNPD